MKKLNFAVIGAGGYAQTHIAMINKLEEEGLSKLTACVIRDPNKLNYKAIEEKLIKSGVKIYRNYQEMYEKEKGKVDVVAIPSSIEWHSELSIKAIESGYHVICEKPAAGTSEEAEKMKNASLKYNKILSIGYQNIFSPSIQRIKQISLEKKLGNLLKVKALVLGKRTANYFKRNYWAGKISVDGKFIYDSPTQNSSGHFLNNLFYIAGDSLGESAEPVMVYGENYRIKDIESADTQYLNVGFKNKVELFFYTSQAVINDNEPLTEIVFENGRIEWFQTQNGLTKVYEGQRGCAEKIIEKFDNGSIDPKEQVFSESIDAINNNRQPLSNIFNAVQHTICIEKSFDSSGGVVSIPDKYKAAEEIIDSAYGNPDSNIAVKGVEKIMEELYQKEISFYDHNVEWAKKSKFINL